MTFFRSRPFIPSANQRLLLVDVRPLSMRAEAALLLLLLLQGCCSTASFRAPHIYPTAHVKTSMNATTNATMLFTSMLNASELTRSKDVVGINIRSAVTRKDVGLKDLSEKRVLNLTAVTWNLAELPVSTSPSRKDYSFFKQYRKSGEPKESVHIIYL